MKKKLVKEKLKLDKVKVARLQDRRMIVGGGELFPTDSCDDCQDSLVHCTVTIVGATSKTRPTVPTVSCDCPTFVG